MNQFKKYFWEIIIHQYVDFKGRASRKEFWSFFTACVIIYFLVSFLIAFSFSFFSSMTDTFVSTNIVWPFILILYLIILMPSLAIAVRRLHDSGQSGWWFLIGFVPYVGGIVLFIFYLLPSQKKENKWGQIPNNK